MRSVSKAIFRRRSGSTCWSFIVAKCPRPMAGRVLESEWTGLRLCFLKAEMTLRYQCAAGVTSAAFFLVKSFGVGSSGTIINCYGDM
jgi:hypothetical protein